MSDVQRAPVARPGLIEPFAWLCNPYRYVCSDGHPHMTLRAIMDISVRAISLAFRRNVGSRTDVNHSGQLNGRIGSFAWLISAKT
jgi:hypothetical protein